MGTTTNFGWNYGTRGQNPWWSEWQTIFQVIDTEMALKADKKMGGTATRSNTEGTNHLDIFDGVAPVGTLTNGCSIYSAAGELYAMDAAGNATLQTPHDDKGEWVFYSRNTVTGKTLKIDMERMMRKLNELLGGDFIHEFTEEVPCPNL